jgi:TRAP-type mannitol/chloroaromatic compound transport system permease small subunit
MNSFLRVIDRINDFLGAIAMVFLVVMIGDMLYEVVSRRVFGAPTMWAYDISYMLNGVGFMFAAGYTLRRNGHIRIDFLSSRFKYRNQDLINAVAYIALVIPALAFLTMGAYAGWLNAFLTNELEPASAWQPLLWPLYGGILIGYVSLTLQSLAELIRHFRAVMGLEPSPLARSHQVGSAGPDV